MSEKENEKFPNFYQERRRKIIEYLENSNPEEAYIIIRSMLDYPGQIDNDFLLQDALGLFERITSEIVGEHLALLVKNVVENPNNNEALYDLSYELYEQNLYGIAATLLKRADDIVPQDPKIVSELVSNLEELMLNYEAYKILSNSKKLIETNDLCRYLLAYNSLMTGNIEEPLNILPSLKKSDDPDIRFMSKSLKGMLNRALVLRKNRTLDKQDLRGWHMVLNGSILLHLSPFGLNDGMFGRYAYISDSFSLIRDGIERLKAIFDASKIEVHSILALPDRSSQVLAMATSRILGITLKDWNDMDINTPGLIIAYDLDEIHSSEISNEIADHRPGQILWVHASCWTNPFPISPDITTYLYQQKASPWGGGGMGYNMKLKRITITEADKANDEELSKRILEATIDEEYINDLDDLLSMIEPLDNLNEEDKPGIYKKAGRRLRQRKGSPVQSNRFY